MNNINLDALHKVPEILELRGSFGRQFGKTTYCLYTILGYLQTLENEHIIVLIPRFKHIEDYYRSLISLFIKNELDYKIDKNSRRIFFKNNSNQIKFLTLESIQRDHPTSFSNSYNLYLITDLEEMPPQFYKEEITIGDCNILNKYLGK